MARMLRVQFLVTVLIGVFWLSPEIPGALLGPGYPPAPSHSCKTKDCRIERLEKAATVLKSRDETVNPCENFFKHACGNWKEPPVPIFQSLAAVKESKVEQLIEGISRSDHSKVHRLVRNFYRTCMDDKARGEKPLDLVNEISMFWPPVAGDEWDEASFDWIDWQEKSKKAGYVNTAFVDWFSMGVFHTERQLMMHYLHAPLGLFNFKFNDGRDFQNDFYKDYMAKVALLLGADEADVSRDVTAAYEFEKKLHRIYPNMNFTMMRARSIEQFQEEFPGIDWDIFVNKTLTPLIEFADTESIFFIMDESAMTEFIKLMNATPKRVQATYAIWKEIQLAIPFLTPEFVEAHNHFLKAIRVPEMSRKKFCIEITRNSLAYAVEDLYLDQLGDSKATIDEIFGAIKEQMLEMVNNSKVLSEEDKKKGNEILEQLDYSIGRTKKLGDKKALENWYADAELRMDNFLQTLLNINILKTEREYSSKHMKGKFEYPLVSVIGRGLPINVMNHLFIPTTMIPSAAFSNDAPMYLNFGAAGSHLAREIFGSVRVLGRKITYGEDGPHEQLDCFSNNSQSFFPPTQEMSPDSSLDDVITQFMGLRVSYLAYKQFKAESGPEKSLPYLPYSPEQLFWVSFAQSICPFRAKAGLAPNSSASSNQMDELMTTVLRNIPEIAADFNCPVGSSLNPEIKCSWW